MKILLDRFKSKSSNDKRKGVTVSFKNSKKLLSELNMSENLSEFETYRKERLASTKYRLVFEVNPVCTNVLFNTATEIVKDEGSNNVIWLTNTPKKIDDGTIIGKPSNITWDSVTGVMDTQISKPEIGYEYHCGYDIFDNHLLRSTAFRTVNYTTAPLGEFNTIADVQRDYKGKEVHRYPDDMEDNESYAGPLLPNHLYDRENLLSFEDAIDANLIERNGWFGFTNPTTMNAYDEDGKNMGINRLINSKGTCDFIDMYPGRDLYSFVPKYNKSRGRFEKNWNYCLTYPSSSTTKNIDFINEDLESLKAAYFNEQTVGRNGRRVTTIYSVAKHGLGAGDTVNVYKSYKSGSTMIHEMCLSGVTVSTVVDDYTFTVYAGTQRISDQWIDVDDNASAYTYYPTDIEDTSTLEFNAKRDRLVETDPTRQWISFPIIDGRSCVDMTTMNLSFKRVEAGFECKYYVRIFSRLPNFKFAKMDVTERNLYNPLSDIDLIKDNQMEPFQDNLSKLAFASNSYSDANAELVFLDDVDVNGLRDNLGRPLTEIYLTCVKNNAGYKDWYGKNKDKRGVNLTADTVEYSHAFGKVNCGYILSDASREDRNYCNVLFMTNISAGDRGNIPGMNVKSINPGQKEDSVDSDDEINFGETRHFYGDLCEFCVGSYTERSLQEIYHRFNTAQRELTENDTAFSGITEQCKYHEIVSDDFDSDGFYVDEYSLKDSIVGAEGYIYKPHNRIELRTFNAELEVGYPRICTPRFINSKDNDMYQIRTIEDNYFEEGNKFLLYNVNDNNYYNCIIYSVDDPKTVTFKAYDTNWAEASPRLDDISIYRTASPDSSIPPYAFMSTDGSMRYFWHTVMANGFNSGVEEEEYPFANGAFYVSKKVNIYVRRQDPYGFNGLWRTTMLGNIDGSHSNIIAVDNYVTEGDIEC